MADYDRAGGHELGDADLHRQRAEVLDRLGRHQEALAAAQRALELSPEHTWYGQDVGYYALKAGEYRTAVAVLQEAERLEGLAALHALMLGLALLASGDPAGAEAAYLQAVELCRGADPILANADLSVAGVKLDEVARVRPDLEEEIEESCQFLEAAREELRDEDEEVAWPKAGTDQKLTPEEAEQWLEEFDKRTQAFLGDGESSVEEGE